MDLKVILRYSSNWIEINTKKGRVVIRIKKQTQIIQENGGAMEFTGRPMKEYVLIYFEGYDLDVDLESWVNLSLAFNPLAKKSKRKILTYLKF